MIFIKFREDKRAIQRRLKALETMIDHRFRDESRRARKQAQLVAFIDERENELQNTFEGEARPDSIHQKTIQVQTIKDELNARASELSVHYGTNIDPEVMEKFNNVLSRTTNRIAELQEAKLQSQELDGLLQDFNNWAEEALERTLSATNSKLSSTFETIQVRLQYNFTLTFFITNFLVF